MSSITSNGLSALLGARRIKIATVSRDTGISRSTLTGLYYGKTKGVSFAVLGKLCEYLSCSVEDILHREQADEASDLEGRLGA